MKENDLVAVRQKASEETAPYSLRKIFIQLLSGAAGFFLAQTGVFGGYAPFGVAFAAAAPSGGGWGALAGVAGGYISAQSGAMPLRYIAAVLAVSIIRRALNGLKTNYNEKISIPVSAFLCSIATGLALAYSQGFASNLILMYTAEGLLAAGASYFFHQTFVILNGTRGFTSISKQELSCVMITVCLLLMSLSQYEIYNISPVRIVTVFGILVAARYGREAAGSIAGIAAGITMSLSNSENMAFLAGAYAFGGLLAGVFSHMGRFGTAAAFAVANGIVAILQNGSPGSISGLYEVAAATVFFVIMPPSWSKRLERYFSPGESIPATDGLRQSMVSRLDFAANAMSEVSEAVEAVSEKLRKIYSGDLESVYQRVQNTVCAKCGLRLYCWENIQNETLGTFHSISGILKKKEILEKEDVPEYFVNRCIKIIPIIEGFNHSYMDYITKTTAEERVSEIRAIVADQFGGIADMLSDLSKEFYEAEQFDGDAALRVGTVMRAFNLEPLSVTCRLDKYARMTVEATTPMLRGRLDKLRLNRTLNEACDRLFDLPAVMTMGKETRLVFCERASITVQTGAFQYAYMDGVLCGDAYECFQDGRGRELLIISDGMGSGGRAAVDGAMAAGLLSRLIKAGFGFDCSLRVVNSAMLVKSGDESLATLDIVSIDLFTGYTEFLKAGAAPTFVRRSGRAGKIEQNSLPTGILRQVEFGKSSLTLSAGDIILMVSDGVMGGSTEWIVAELESWKDGSANELAQKIANEARRRRIDCHDDDITVLAAFLKKGA